MRKGAPQLLFSRGPELLSTALISTMATDECYMSIALVFLIFSIILIAGVIEVIEVLLSRRRRQKDQDLLEKIPVW